MITAISINSSQIIIYIIIAIVIFLGIQKVWRIMIQKMEGWLEQNAVTQSQQKIEQNPNPTELDIILYVDNWIQKPTKDTEKPPVYFLQHPSEFLPYLEKVRKDYPDIEIQKQIERLYNDIKIFSITE